VNQALNKLYKKSATQLKWASFFIAYPYWTIIQNLSFFLTVRFIFTARQLPIDFIRIRSLPSFFAILLMLGAINSTLGAAINLGYDYFSLAIGVLPNYLYWGLLIIIIGNVGLRVMPLEKFYESFFYAIVTTILTYYFFRPILDPIPFFRNVSQNNFAFLMIIFGPMATAHVQKRWNNNFYTLIFIVLISLAGFLSGSRSGSIFTLVGCSLVLALGNWIKTIIVLFIGTFLSVATPEVIDSPAVKTTIHSLNERTYDLVYETEETMTTDRSYLTRLAMIEKGMNIFEQYPMAGIGIGNFSNKSFKVDFNFEGADLLMHKEDEFERTVNPHNSYISFLSEGGLILFIPFLLCLFYPIYYFLINFNQIKSEEKAVFISIIFMCIHSWFITGMVNVYGWFILGVANSYIIHKSRAKKIIINGIRVSLPQ
jgi:O-antigen ligase